MHDPHQSSSFNAETHHYSIDLPFSHVESQLITYSLPPNARIDINDSTPTFRFLDLPIEIQYIIIRMSHEDRKLAIRGTHAVNQESPKNWTWEVLGLPSNALLLTCRAIYPVAYSVLRSLRQFQSLTIHSTPTHGSYEIFLSFRLKFGHLCRSIHRVNITNDQNPDTLYEIYKSCPRLESIHIEQCRLGMRTVGTLGIRHLPERMLEGYLDASILQNSSDLILKWNDDDNRATTLEVGKPSRRVDVTMSVVYYFHEAHSTQKLTFDISIFSPVRQIINRRLEYISLPERTEITGPKRCFRWRKRPGILWYNRYDDDLHLQLIEGNEPGHVTYYSWDEMPTIPPVQILRTV